MKFGETDKRMLNNSKTEKVENFEWQKNEKTRGRANWNTKIGKSKVENTLGPACLHPRSATLILERS